MHENNLVPNSYFALGKRKGGLKTGGISESDIARTLLLVGENISRRLLSRLCAQAYDRLGLFMGAMSKGLKILKSCACELADISELDPNLSERDPDFTAMAKKIPFPSRPMENCLQLSSRSKGA